MKLPDILKISRDPDDGMLSLPLGHLQIEWLCQILGV